jgi:2-dehydropantoate 2-reductase
LPTQQINTVAVMGAGAVGCYFGGMLARAGIDVTLIARGAHLEALQRDGLFMDSIRFQERVAIKASGDPSAVRGAQLVLFCVKSLDTESAANSIAAHLNPGAVVLTLQNGVDNAQKIRALTGISALPTVVYAAVALSGPGRLRHAGRGDLVLGKAPMEPAATIAATFERAGIPCRLSDNVDGELWQKLVLNCASNAVTGLCRAGYALAVRNPYTRQMMMQVIEETVKVANASGVRMPVDTPQLTSQLLSLFESYGTEAVSSTAQDLLRGRKTEIDALNGYVARRGAELGIPAPVNQTLHALVKLVEDTFDRAASANGN